MEQGFDLAPFPEAVFPAGAVFGSGGAYTPSIAPGAVTGSAGNSSGVLSDFAGTTGGASSSLAYGNQTAKKPFYNQPIFWAVAVFALGVWLLAHIALVEVKS